MTAPTLYRIACRYEPDHPRIAGRTTRKKRGGRWVGHAVRRGVFRVTSCWRSSANDLPDSPGNRPVMVADVRSEGGGKFLLILATRRMRPGQLVNPRRVIAEYLAARREAAA